MPRNSSGVYSLPQAPFVPNTVISSAAVNSDFSDIASALTGSIAANGSTPITGQLKSSVAGSPAFTSNADATTGFTSQVGEADIYVGGSIILAVTAAGITVTGSISLSSLDITGSLPAGVSIAVSSGSPSTITWTAHGLGANSPFYITASVIPPGLSSTQVMYVVGSSITANTFQYSVVPNGAPLNTTGTGTAVLGFAYTDQSNLTGGITVDVLQAGYTTTSKLAVTSTHYWIAASGTTAQRPATVGAGMQRFNTDLALPEWYDGATWRQPVIAAPLAGAYSGLVITNDAGSPTTKINVTATALVVATSLGVAYNLPTVSLVINSAINGANGLDAGSLTQATWYAVWVIYNPTTNTVAGLLSLSGTSPTLPAGYTAFTRFGWVRTAAGAATFLNTLQLGNKAQYVLGTQVAPIIASGTAGTYSATSPTLAAVSVSSVVPSTATVINIVATTNWKSATGPAQFMVAPNTNYGGANNGPEGTNGQIYPIWQTGVNYVQSLVCPMLLESTNIAWASNSSVAALGCLGWQDNLN